MKRVAVVLSGCGHLDGAEIRESVLTLLELDKHNAVTEIFAPNIEQANVINHLDGSTSNEKRNVLIESARIARGKIKDLKYAKADDFDALILPGGYGVVKNLSDISFNGASGKAISEIEELIQSFFAAKKPIGAICISPAIIASVLKNSANVKLTLGESNPLLNNLGATEEICLTNNIVVDEDHKVVSTSAYMRDDRLKDIHEGISKLVKKVLELCK